jgi:hypothetical protein
VKRWGSCLLHVRADRDGLLVDVTCDSCCLDARRVMPLGGFACCLNRTGQEAAQRTRQMLGSKLIMDRYMNASRMHS